MVMLVERAVSVGVALDKHQVIGVAGIVQVAVGLVRCLEWWEEEQREAFLLVTSQVATWIVKNRFFDHQLAKNYCPS